MQSYVVSVRLALICYKCLSVLQHTLDNIHQTELSCNFADFPDEWVKKFKMVGDVRLLVMFPYSNIYYEWNKVFIYMYDIDINTDINITMKNMIKYNQVNAH